MSEGFVVNMDDQLPMEMRWRLMFYGHCCARGRLNGPKGYEAKSKLKHPSDRIRTQLTVFCGPTRYQLDHRGAPYVSEMLRLKTFGDG